jgi:hypothetical protein
MTLSTGVRFCPQCGKAVEPVNPNDTDPTILGDEFSFDAGEETIAPGTTGKAPRRISLQTTPPQVTPPQTTPRQPRITTPGYPVTTSSDPIGGGRFAPGTVVAERYRIVAMLGRGGMGEVYRADDLKLSQVVAIKFMPEALVKDASALERFHSEVRIARHISHSNVCRVFDIGEVDGALFLTMEYVDGEDLASLIRRIGRLPQDKATEVSRQICSGLAAAHDRGVIHRDLKPANVMLDGAGKVRIMDFGLAGIAASIQGAEVRAGTPAYMAPEQLAGKEVTVKSDIYSLGLVMYEVLTGKRAFDATTMQELLKSRQAGTLPNPSTLVRNLDPLLERTVQRCLENDPAKRPASAMHVSAALPGGDPLAAALAAGETPSPEMVAAAGETSAMDPRLGVLCLVGVGVLLTLLILVAKRTKMVSYIPFGPSPEVLADKASTMIRSFGYTNPPLDRARGFTLESDYLREIQEKYKTANRWDIVRQDQPPFITFWYRENPRLLTPIAPTDNLVFGRVTPDSPELNLFDARLVVLTVQGKLVNFRAIPPQVDDSATEESPRPAAPDWGMLFGAAGLDPAQFKPVQPKWFPLAWGDTRAAWEGFWPSRPEVPLRIEAAGFRGKPIYFELLSPWNKPTRMVERASSSQNVISQWFSFVLLCLILGFGIYISTRNLRAGRGDVQGSVRLALFVMIVGVIDWALLAHHVSSSFEVVLLVLGISGSLFFGGVTWVLYAALEPYVRRHWPGTLVSWSRMLAGKFKDPVFGRDVLLGTLFGLTSALLEQLKPILERHLGKAPVRPMGLLTTFTLEGFRGSLATVFYQAATSFSSALIIFFIFFMFRVIFRRNWLAALAMALVFCIPSLAAQNPLIDALFTAPFFIVYLLILYRFGLVALTVLYFVDQLADTTPLVMPLSAWYAEGGVMALITILAVAIYGFQVSRGGKSLFSAKILEI